MINILKTKNDENSLSEYLKKKIIKHATNYKLYMENHYIIISIDSNNFWLRE